MSRKPGPRWAETTVAPSRRRAPARHLVALRCGALAVLGGLALGACRREPRPGASYPDLPSLERDMPKYAIIGRIQDTFPATVVRVERGRDTLGFQLRAGDRHLHRGFDRYRLKAVILTRPDSAEGAVVFQSDAKYWFRFRLP